MSSRQIVRRSGSTADENKLEATCSGDDESVYAGSSSSSRGSSWGSSLSSSDGYLHSADSCCSDRDDCRHYEEIRDDGWAVQRHLSAEHHHHRLCAYPRAASGDVIQTQSRWTASSLLCGVSTLLAACSLSSLTVCIAVTGISLTRIGASGRATSDVVQSASQRNDNIADEAQIPRETERMLLTPLTDYRSSKQNNTATQSERRRTARYNWDCNAEQGFAKCIPVQKARSLRDGPLSSNYRHGSQNATLHVLADGVYHVSVQMTGKVWLAPPTLLRAVIARVQPKIGSVNVTTAHTIIGVADSSHSLLRGAFSVYTAAAVHLGAGDELLANVVCVEQPECIVHVNGTTSYLTMERLD